ncbi:MAG TPA: hypothetical protein VNI20_00905 [Fimbriimonadaceae bacterium]|nr:hypothetical protein [Fimbriimonadaceae bacterium]
MKNNLKSTILATLGIASLAVAVPFGVAHAQDAGQQPPQTDRRGQQTPPPLDQRRNDRLGGQQGLAAPEALRRMGPGNATMVVDQQFLYILMGNQMFKVNKNTLEVVGHGMLPMGGPGGPERPGGFGGGPQGGPPQGGSGVRRGGGGDDLELPGDPAPPQ